MFTQDIFITTPEKEQKTPLSEEKSYSPLTILLQIPENFICPVSHEIMRDPVMLCPSGISYDRRSIDGWKAQGKNTDPLTKEIITNIVTNITLKNSIHDFLKKINLLIDQAIADNNMTLIKILLQEEHIEDTDKIDKIMPMAIQHDSVNIMELCLRFGANIIDKYLHLAIKHLSVEAVKFLLEHKVNPNVRDDEEWRNITPLHRLYSYDNKEEKISPVTCQKQLKIAKTLLEHKADVYSETRWGRTPLTDAFQNLAISRELLLPLLLELESNPRDPKNLALQYLELLKTACFHGHVDGFHLLFESNRISEILTNVENSKSIIMNAIYCDKGSERLQIVSSLLKNPEIISNISKPFFCYNWGPNTALLSAIHSLDIPLIKILLDCKADPNVTIPIGETAYRTALTTLCTRYIYHFSVHRWDPKTLRLQEALPKIFTLLLDHGAHFDSPIPMHCYIDKDVYFSKPVLIWAAEQKDETIFRILISYDKGRFFDEFKSIYQENSSINFRKSNTMKNRLFSQDCTDKIICMRDLIQELEIRDTTRKKTEEKNTQPHKTDIAWNKLKQKIVTGEINLSPPLDHHTTDKHKQKI